MSATPDPRAEVPKRPAFEAPAMRRPAATVFGVVIVVLRVVAGVVWLASVALLWDDLVRDDLGVVLETAADPEGASSLALGVLLVAGGLVLLVDLVLAIFVWRGSNGARIAVMLFSTISITSAWVESVTGDVEISVRTTFITLALDILLLLALSSRAARAWARRPRPRRRSAS